MSIQPFMLIYFLVWLALFAAFWKIKHKNARIIIGLFAVILFMFNPVRFKQEGIAQIERQKGNDFAVPPRTIVDSMSFEDRQALEMGSLKKQSEDMKDEIHN